MTAPPMQLEILILTDHARSSQNKRLLRDGAGGCVLPFAELPVERGFGIAFGLDVPWEEDNQRHELRLEIEDPDGARLGDEFA